MNRIPWRRKPEVGPDRFANLGAIVVSIDRALQSSVATQINSGGIK